MVDYCIKNKFIFNTSTNGTNSSPRALSVIKKAVASGVLKNIQVSLDGPAYVQNKNRPFFSNDASYPYVRTFIDNLNAIQKDLKIDHVLWHNCSTIYLEPDVKQIYLDIIDYFCMPESEGCCGQMAGRIENHRIFTPDDRDLFIDTVAAGCKRLIEIMRRVKHPLYDHYSGKIFNSTSRIDGYVECSGCNTQIGIDLDGSIYMCHGPITTPTSKQEFTVGNLFDNVLDFRALMCAIDSFHAKSLSFGICKTCPVITHNEATGYVCFSCPPSSVSLDGFPSPIDYYKCQAYQRLMPAWIELHNVAKEYRR